MPSGNKEVKKIDVDLIRERKAQPSTMLLAKIPAAVYRGVLTPFIPKGNAAISELSVGFYKQTKEDANKQALIKLQRAVLDDDQKTITAILDGATPQRLRYLLTTNPADVGIPDILSNTPGRSTFQRFKSEPIFKMAQGLRRPEAVMLIAPYFERSEELIKERAKQWVLPKPYSEAEQKIMQDYYIKKYFHPIIKTLAADNTIRVPWEKNPKTNLFEANILHPSQATSATIDAFRNKLLPEEAIDLDKLDTPSSLGAADSYVDMEQFFKAAVRACDEHFAVFGNDDEREWDRRKAYSIAFLGLIIPLLGPEHGKKFCASLYDWVNSSDVFLMADPQNDNNYIVSDKNNLYLYHQKGQVVYYVENNQEPQPLPAELKLPESAFTATPTNQSKCLDEQLIAQILKITSQRYHTFAMGRILSPDAQNLIMKDGRRFMLESREFLSGAGVNFLCDMCGGPDDSQVAGSPPWRRRLKNYFRQTQHCLGILHNTFVVSQSRSPTLRN